MVYVCVKKRIRSSQIIASEFPSETYVGMAKLEVELISEDYLDREIFLRASGKARVNIRAFSEASSDGLL